MWSNRKLVISIVFVLLFKLANCAIASDTDTSSTTNGIVIGYWGTLNHNPGIKLGFEKTLHLSPKYNVLSSVSLLLNRKLNVCTSAGVILSNMLRKTGKRSLYFEYGINFGYLGSYYDFDFYRTNANGEIINVGRKWLSSIMLGYSFGLGYDFSKKTKTDLQIFIKPGIYYRFPNNDNIFYLNNYFVEMGMTFHPKWLNSKR